jgi:hypothetical protein
MSELLTRATGPLPLPAVTFYFPNIAALPMVEDSEKKTPQTEVIT